MKEIWKDIEDYEGLYQVSSIGNIKSIKRERKLKKINHSGGYLVVCLCKHNKRKNKYIHRLVAAAFVINLLGKTTVNHKDGDKTNNIFINLEWCTQSENIRHAHRTGLDNQKGENNDHSKLDNRKVLLIRKENNASLQEIGNKYGVSAATICRIINRKAWQHV